MTKKEIIIEEEGLDIAQKIKKLQAKIKQYKKEKEEYLTGWQRAKADFINARKEEDKNREKFAKLANQFLISDLLVVLDSFELALKTEKDANLSAVQGQLKNILQKHGLEEIKALGEKFDPQLHEAVEEIESEEESGTILEETQKGYLLNGKVIRATRVKISK